MNQWQSKLQKECSGRKKVLLPNIFTGNSEKAFLFLMISIKLNAFLALLHRKKVKNNREKSLIFVTLAEFKWKAGAEEVLFTSILFHLSCLVESPGPEGVCPLAWHTLGAEICSAGWLPGRVQIYFCLLRRILGWLLLGRMSAIPISVYRNVTEAAKVLPEKSILFLF